MKERNKILVTILVLVLIILAAFAALIEYRFGMFTKTDEEKLPLLAKIFAAENSGITPFKANFTSLVLYYEGYLKYHWDFGDNETSDEINPTHIYNKSGSYICTLTVTDKSGEKSIDRVEILVRVSQSPTVSINMPVLKPSRPFIPIIWREKISQFYNGQTLRRLIDSKFFPKSLLSRNGFVSCSATASSPEGNEIASYKWELSPPTYTSIAGQQRKPVYYFEGQNITIPLFYTYPQAPYDLTVIVTDSKGNTGTGTIQFNVELSPLETQILQIKRSVNTFRLQVWHTVLKDALAGPVGSVIYNSVFSKLPSWPLLKLFIVFQLGSKWAVNPEGKLTTRLLAQFLKKHTGLRNIVEKNLERVISLLEKIKLKRPNLAGAIDKLIDIVEKLLENIDISNKRPVISNEVPSDESKHLSTSYPEVAVTVEDPEGDPFNVTIHGKYVNNITLLNQYNNTFVATLITPLPNLTDIYWHVNVSYSDSRWVNATYKFSTW